MTGDDTVDCDKVAHRMHHYLDGEVAVWRRWTIKRHLHRCPPCADCFTFEVEVRQIVANRCREEMPPDAKRRITDALGLHGDDSPTP